MGEPWEEAWEKVRKSIEGLSAEEKKILRRKLLQAVQERTNLDERLIAAGAFAAAMNEETDSPGGGKGAASS